MTEASTVEGPYEKVTLIETAIATKAVKPIKAAGLSEAYAEIISASGIV